MLPALDEELEVVRARLEGLAAGATAPLDTVVSGAMELTLHQPQGATDGFASSKLVGSEAREAGVQGAAAREAAERKVDARRATAAADMAAKAAAEEADEGAAIKHSIELIELSR